VGNGVSTETDADTIKMDTGEPCCPNLAGLNWKSPGKCSRGNDFTRREGRADVIMRQNIHEMTER
jgi:hypothetical protein